MSNKNIEKGWEIPEGYMLVRKEWEPIMSEIDRRASKEWGMVCDFTVTVYSDEYSALDEAERIPMPEGKCNE